MARHLAQINDRTGLIVMCVIFSITSTAAVVLRFYSRKLKGLEYQMDDWLAAVALVRSSPRLKRFFKNDAELICVVGIRPRAQW